MVVPENYILSGKEWGPRFIELDALSNVSFTQRVICTHNNPFYVHKDLLGTASNEAFNLLNNDSNLLSEYKDNIQISLNKLNFSKLNTTLIIDYLKRSSSTKED